MHAHAADLRVEIKREGDERDVEELCRALLAGWRDAELSPLESALAGYAEKLTLSPQEMSERDVEGLRAVGLDDVAIHDLIQVTAYFNYINRIADAVNVDLEPEMPPHSDRVD
jgi:uncharacterized peroxidase-related enzyme